MNTFKIVTDIINRCSMCQFLCPQLLTNLWQTNVFNIFIHRPCACGFSWKKWRKIEIGLWNTEMRILSSQNSRVDDCVCRASTSSRSPCSGQCWPVLWARLGLHTVANTVQSAFLSRNRQQQHRVIQSKHMMPRR